jgi:SAM-dependent MidA family methyltransferase
VPEFVNLLGRMDTTREINILEIGGGTGGTTKALLNQLTAENIDFPRGIHATKEVDKVLGQVISRTLEHWSVGVHTFPVHIHGPVLRAADSGTQEV